MARKQAKRWRSSIDHESDEVNGRQVTMHYGIPVLPGGKGDKKGDKNDKVEVLPMVTPGGPWGTVPELLFEKNDLIPAVQQLLISYSAPRP